MISKVSSPSVINAGTRIKGLDQVGGNESPTMHPNRGKIKGIAFMLVYSTNTRVGFLNLRAAIIATMDVKKAALR